MTRTINYTAIPELLQPARVPLPTSRHATEAASVLARLRGVAPRRALDEHALVTVAEQQADLLLRLAQLTKPPTPSAVVTELPRILVRLDPTLQASAGTHWLNGRWLILINSGEPLARQRFSLCHELKHCLDHPLRATLYRGTTRHTPAELAELAADAFAAALLMPGSWVRLAWLDGLSVVDLASHFVVSEQAMRRRLATLGLIPSIPEPLP